MKHNCLYEFFELFSFLESNRHSVYADEQENLYYDIMNTLSILRSCQQTQSTFTELHCTYNEKQPQISNAYSFSMRKPLVNETITNSTFFENITMGGAHHLLFNMISNISHTFYLKLSDAFNISRLIYITEILYHEIRIRSAF